ncbi:MAG TPA: hypothetical protein VGB90_09470 [Alphaproteobacteria bacterium]
MTARAPRIALVAATLAAVLAVEPATADEGATAPENQRDLPVGSQYFRLDPFTVPVMGPDSITRHLTFIVTLELTDDGLRDKVRQNLPRLRHAINASLFQLVTVRRDDGSLPPLATVKRRMLEVTKQVAGGDTVRDVLMESVYERRI